MIAVALAALGVGHFRSERSAPHGSAGGGRIVETVAGGFTLGRLAFSRCDLTQRNTAATTAAFCAPFRVPENWDRPDGRQIDLKVAIVRGDAEVA
ncbi:MAG TPA: hypothetical protein VG871_09715, partial [Vicinamibacterales bacterium]|nr:hypothetical protein [Vicinamibacterales bacterium]